jgi:hypothetical protein
MQALSAVRFESDLIHYDEIGGSCTPSVIFSSDEMSMLSKTPTGMIKMLHAKRSSAELIPVVSLFVPY